MRFGECVLDMAARTVVRRGAPVPLSPKAFQLLEILLEHQPAAIRHENLRDRLWPDTHVGYTSLARLVAEVRNAIGDVAGKGELIRTVRGFGYAFSGTVEPAGDARDGNGTSAVFQLRTPNGEIDLVEGENVIGRDRDCRVCLPADRVSRRHARIVVSGDRALIEDLGSKNGTRLNGARLTAPTGLTVGDELMVGHEVLVFVAVRPSDVTRTDRTATGGG